MSDELPKGATAPFPVVEIGGRPHDMGLAYGRAAGERVLRSIAIYRGALERDGVAWTAARALADRLLPGLRADHVDAVDELTGVAEGVGVPLSDIVAINARTELLYGRDAAPREPDGCTGAIALPGATGGRLLHGQNWDWRDECADTAVVLRVRPADGPAFMTFVEAGLLARCGFNAHGVALTGNYIQCEHDFARTGTPAPFIRRKVLSSTGLADACEAVFTAKVSFSNTMMISQATADGDGEGFALEATPVETFWIATDDGILVHSNHFLAPSARAKVRDTGLFDTADSLYRDVRVRRALTAAQGRVTRETMIAAFQDRFGAPKAVCRSPVTGPGGSTSSTVATVIMDAGAGRMWIAPRPYGPHVFTEYRLD